MDKKTFERGLRAADSRLFQEDKIWSRYSSDKVDIGETLVRALRTLEKALPLKKELRALSIGSSNEPQFRLLETSCRGGLYLLDVEKGSLDIVRERIRRQYTDHVATIHGDFNKIFLRVENTGRFLENRLKGQRVNLITLHHSMYYCDENKWRTLFGSLYGRILAPVGAMHAVLMASGTDEPSSTTRLYNYFVGKFFGLRDTQDLRKFTKELKRGRLYRKAQVLTKSSRVRFFVDDFEKFMAVVWMIMLYPNVHHYSLKQREEITEFVYEKFWLRKRPLVQAQDHMVIYRGIGFRGLI